MSSPVLPGAEPIDLPGGPVGVLLSHGFTGTTQSMRPWAEHLSAHGLSVVAPRLPGHGTRWQDMNDTGWDDCTASSSAPSTTCVGAASRSSSWACRWAAR